MRSKLIALLPLFLVATSSVARADNIETLTASGTFTDGATLSGTATLDSTTGIFTAADLAASSPDSFTFTSIQVQGCPPSFLSGGCWIEVGAAASGTPTVNLLFGISSFVGFTGGTIASDTDPFFDPVTTIGYASIIDNDPSTIFLSSGELSDSSGSGSGVTPEPSSLILLGTGVLGVLGIARRRLTT